MLAVDSRKALLYDGNANVDAEASNGKTPLIIAAEHGRLDCVRYLLDKGADADRAAKDRELAIHKATWKGHLGCVEALLPRTSQHALLKACYGSQVTEDPYWLPVFLDRIRSKGGALEFPEMSVSVLHIAVEYERLEILEHLLEKGLHPDHYVTIRQQMLVAGGCRMWAETALGLACEKCSVPMVTALLDHGAQFSFGSYLVWNPLDRALTAKCPSGFIRFLVERGADVNSHIMDDSDVPPSIRDAFKHPHLLHELLVLGYRLKYWDLAVSRGVGHVLVEMARDPRSGDVLFNVLMVLAQFAPRHKFRPLYSILKSICEGDPIRPRIEWAELDRQLASPQSLLDLCTLKTREVLMMRRVFRLESDVSILELPQSLREYLMFR